MFCEKCGSELEKKSKFCPVCGSPVEVVKVQETQTLSSNNNKEIQFVMNQNEQQDSNNDNIYDNNSIYNNSNNNTTTTTTTDSIPNGNNVYKKPVKKTTLFGIAGLAVLVLVILIIAISSSGSKYKTFGNNTLSYIIVDEETHVFTGKKEAFKFESEISSVYYNIDTTVMAFIDYNDDNILYIATKSGYNKVADNVYNFRISENGKGIAYVTSSNYNSTGELYWYDASSKKSKVIADEVIDNSFVISPDGKTVAYIGDYKSSDNFKAYYSISGKSSVELGKKITPVAISDNAKYVYYLNDKRFYVVKKGKDAVKLSNGIGYEDIIIMSNNYEQVVFSSDGYTYVCKNAGEKQKISNDKIIPVVPNTVAERYYYISGMSVVVYGIDSFASNYAISSSNTYNYSLQYINAKYEAKKIGSASLANYIISSNGKEVVYRDYDYIYKVTNPSSVTAAKKIGENLDIDTIIAAGDLSYIYFINDYDELYYIKGSNKAKKIADDVKYSNIYMDYTDGRLYYVIDETDVYTVKNGTKSKIFSGERVSLNNRNRLIFAIDEKGRNEYDIYTLDSGKSKKVFSNIEIYSY